VDLPYIALGVRAGERLLSLISRDIPQTQSPVLVTGPVYWRASVANKVPERPVSVVRLQTLREE
jgi:LacI family transcriptional regulator